MPRTKALVLFSGGLDSMLAAALLKEQGTQVDLLCFTSGFFSSTAARKAAAEIGLKLKEHDISQALLGIVKNPPNGYGKRLNPCIDCHALMIKQAGEIKRREGYDIIATGEVLGQRPFSQTRGALAKIGKLAETEILRPLSAKLLPLTAAEDRGLVKRHKLYDISGRSRERQLKLAGQFGLSGYTTPAGGCLLTDPEFSERLIIMLDRWPACRINDVALLKYGRIFWLNLTDGPEFIRILLVVGRNEADNEELHKLAKTGDIMLELIEMVGPTSILRGLVPTRQKKENTINVPRDLKMSSLKLGESKSAGEILDLSSLLTAYYSVKARGRTVQVESRLFS